MKYKKYLFVINPISGGYEKEELKGRIRNLCNHHQVDYHIYQTTGKDDEQKINDEITDYQPEIIIAAGGDGTVNLVAKQILYSDKILGILPIGSGNGLAKDLKIPTLVPDALDIIFEPKVIKIDTLEANNRFFMHICDIGFNAHIVRLFNKSKGRGLLSYMKFTVKEFFKYKTFHYVINTEKGTYRGYAFMITTANSNQFGSNLTINPEGKYDDGEFEVIIIKRFPRKRILSIMYRLITKKINFSPYTTILKCKAAEIKTKKKKTTKKKATKKKAAAKAAKDMDKQEQIPQMSLFQEELDPNLETVKNKLEACDPNRMTPVESLLMLSELKKLIDS